jgi:hypothetical protein
MGLLGIRGADIQKLRHLCEFNESHYRSVFPQVIEVGAGLRPAEWVMLPGTTPSITRPTRVTPAGTRCNDPITQRLIISYSQNGVGELQGFDWLSVVRFDCLLPCLGYGLPGPTAL